VHFECRLHQIVRLQGRTAPEDYHLVIGRIVAVHIEDSALTPDGRLDVLKVRPIARLGYKDYSSIESTFEMEKPLREEHR
jgi:flavin reductase (DIM6/NTAB) family NADH-FMN oxidoreductase RutF